MPPCCLMPKRMKRDVEGCLLVIGGFGNYAAIKWWGCWLICTYANHRSQAYLHAHHDRRRSTNSCSPSLFAPALFISCAKTAIRAVPSLDMSYIAPIHRPSSVRHALQINLFSPEEESLVLAWDLLRTSLSPPTRRYGVVC